MFYMVLGYLFRDQFEDIFDRYNTWIFVRLIYLVLIYVPFLARVEMLLVVDVIYDYVASLVGITTVVMTAKVVKLNSDINYVGQITLVCFALHGKAYSVIQTIL